MTPRRGRPPLGNEAATTILRIRVTPGQCHALAAVARENRTTMSGVIREAVDTFVADYSEGPLPFRRRPITD